MDPDIAALHSKLDSLLVRMTKVEERMEIWRSVVLPMSTGFVGVVAGLILAVFALRG